MYKYLFLSLVFLSVKLHAQRSYWVYLNGHSNLVNLDNKFPIQSNNLKKFDGFVAALLVKDPTNKKPRYKIELVSNKNTSIYNNLINTNSVTKLVDNFLALNFSMACISYSFNQYNISFNLGLGVNALAKRNFFNEQNVNINGNPMLPAPIGFGKHITLNNTAEIENNINVSKSVQLSIGLRYTGGLINKFTDTDNFSVKAPPGNNISVTVGFAIKLFGPADAGNDYEDY
jgi:hypothetical protein